MRQLKCHHSRESSHGACKELTGVQKELRVQEEYTTQPEVPLVQLVHQLSHHWNVRVQLYLPCTELESETETGYVIQLAGKCVVIIHHLPPAHYADR